VNTKRYAELFRAEAKERLGDMNTSLLALERGEGIDRVAELFRAVHTVKGMAAAMGYGDVRDLSHALEALLDQLRRESLVITPEIIDTLFEAVDTLESAIALASDQSTEPVDVLAAIEMLESIASLASESPGTNPTMEWPVMSPVSVPAPAVTSTHKLTPAVPASAFGSQQGDRQHRFVRVDADRLDALMNLIGELVIARGRLQDVARKLGNPALGEAVLQASRLIGSLQTEITTARMVPVGQAFERFERMVRDTAQSLGKKVTFEILGSEIEVDKSVLDEIGDPVMHLLRNSLDHGVETPAERRAAGKPPVARLTLSASRERSAVVVRVSDDGRGIDVKSVLARARANRLVDADCGTLSDAEILSLIARPGFSTSSKVTDISGRGVGLDVVATKVRSLGGAVELSTDAGAGTEIRLELPTTLAIIHALLARSQDEIYALPITHVVETLVLEPDMVRVEDDREVLRIRGQSVPAVRLRDRVGHPPRDTWKGHAVVLDLPDGRVTLVVDEFIGQQEVVVKTFDPAHGMPQLFNGATILTNGSPALILDAQGIA
jgi:two-component system chemotaxis sensor kinase CheA